MKKRFDYLLCGLLAILTILLVSSPFGAIAQNEPMEINVVTGNELGEYYAVAKDIEKLARDKQLDIDVIPTRGSLQNIHDVLYYETIPLGITQGDVLAFLNTFANDDEEMRHQAESMRVILPLFQEEVHVIARSGINSIQELTGKKVSIGDEGSGTGTTAATLLYQWEINPEQLFTYDVKRAIDALRNDEIDAMFYVVGTPAKVLEEQILPEDNFQLLPIALEIKPEDEFYSQLYSPTTLSAKTYSWQSEDIQTLAVQSYLVTAENQNCDSVTPVGKLVKDNLTWFQENGEAVWQNSDLNFFGSKQTSKISQCANF